MNMTLIFFPPSYTHEMLNFTVRALHEEARLLFDKVLSERFYIFSREREGGGKREISLIVLLFLESSHFSLHFSYTKASTQLPIHSRLFF